MTNPGYFGHDSGQYILGSIVLGILFSASFDPKRDNGTAAPSAGLWRAQRLLTQSVE